MRGTTGILLIALGLVMLYVVLSDKYSCFVQFVDCIMGNDYRTSEGFTKGDNNAPVKSNAPPLAGDFDIFGLLRKVIP
jgi:hypothetical protein